MTEPHDWPFSAQPGIESADAWIQQASEYLTMWKERHLYPDSSAHQDLLMLHNKVPVREFAKGLPAVLRALGQEHTQWALYAHDDRSPRRYWAGISFEDGRLYEEVGFNYYLEADQHPDHEDMLWLQSAGWVSFDSPQGLNWDRVQSTPLIAMAESAQRAVDVVREAFHLGDLDLIGLRMIPRKDPEESADTSDLHG